MGRHITRAAVVLFLPAALAGCAHSSPTTAPPTPSITPSQRPAATTTPKATAAASPTQAAVPLGTPAAYSGQGSWTITLDKVTCGLTTLPGAQLNPAWTGGTTGQYVTAKPAKGTRFCQLTWTWRNTGTAATNTSLAGDIVIDGTTRERTSDEMMWSMNTTKSQLGVDYSLPVPAKTAAKRIDIYQVPVGHHPSLVWAPTGPGAQAFALTNN